MNLLKKLGSYILPKEVDFFGNLTKQSQISQRVVEQLYEQYVNKSLESDKLHGLIAEAKEMRANNLIELNDVLITPVDKEAISRAYTGLHWIVLSVKHLDVEIRAYQINSLTEYEVLFSSLKKQINELTGCFQLLKEKKYKEVIDHIYQIIHCDNLVIAEYSQQLNKLFEGSDLKYIFQRREILSQLKEISKRIHFCANTVEDMVFKIN